MCYSNQMVDGDSGRRRPTTENDTSVNESELPAPDILSGDDILAHEWMGFFPLDRGKRITAEIDVGEEVEPVTVSIVTKNLLLVRRIEPLVPDTTSTDDEPLNKIVFGITTEDAAKSFLLFQEAKEELGLSGDRPPVEVETTENPLNEIPIFTSGRRQSARLSRREQLQQTIELHEPRFTSIEANLREDFITEYNDKITNALAARGVTHGDIRGISLIARATPRTPTPEPGT